MPSDTSSLTDADAEAVVRVIEAAAQVRRRYHFFVWMQAYLQQLLPHQIAVCGAWQRQHKDVVFEAFDSVAVPKQALVLLTDSSSPVLRTLVGQWVEQGGRCLLASIRTLQAGAEDGAGAGCDVLLAAGIDQMLVHGVARPQRPADIETLFLLTSPNARIDARQRGTMELLLPHLHATYLRVQAVERELGEPGPLPSAPRGAETLTAREREILWQVREGLSNQQIGDALGISALTVKNHVQKILRKLGATNRAHAVARAMSLNLMSVPDAAG